MIPVWLAGDPLVGILDNSRVLHVPYHWACSQNLDKCAKATELKLMEYVNLEEYTEGHSALHKLDARIKLIAAIVTIFCIVFLTHWYLPLLFFGSLFWIGHLYSRASLKVYLKRLLISDFSYCIYRRNYALYLWINDNR